MKLCELNLKMIVPSSVGILIVTSGICFLLWSKNLRKRKTTTSNEAEKKTTVDDSRCACCLKPFFIGRGVECNNCNSRSCGKSCSRWDTDENIWLCLFCHHRRSWLKKNEEWFETFGRLSLIDKSTKQFSTAKSQVCIAGTEHVALNSGLDLAAGGYEERNTMEDVRNLIENIVENLVGNVDNTPINRLYGHSAYDQLFNEYSTQLAGAIAYLALSLQSCITNKPATDTPSMAQTALRELVERAVDEARKLPGLGESVSTTTQSNTSIEERSYEDLLATAILNKVIEKYQKEQIDSNSNVVYEESSKKCKHVKKKLNDSIDEDEDSSSLESSMSHDECSNDCSGNRMRKRHVRQDSLSLTIEEQIEEITTLYTSDEDPGCMKTNILNFQCARRVPFPEFGMDIVDPSQESSDESHDEVDGSAHMDHITPVESWEENWLFQKKKISIQSDPVTMLVPNPNEDYRALIGDKDADDTSDLSEFSAHSDDEVEDEIIEAINCVIPKSSEVEDIIPVVNVNGKIETQKDENCNEARDEEPIQSEEISTSSHMQNPDEITANKDMNVSDGSIIKATDENLFIPAPLAEKEVSEDNDHEPISEPDFIDLTTSNHMDNHKTPRTPASSPLRNSFCDNDASPTTTCDAEELNEKLGSIDKNKQDPADIVRECHVNVTDPKRQITSQFLEQEKIHESNLQLSSPPRPGTIAEREHKKWENAPPIQNNPYSQENIEKRLLERQYSRRPSDVNGNSAILPTTPCPSLQIVIGANRPDIKRFGRDYYINESKSPTGERLNRSSTSISSRPSSSLSHRSNSTSSDFEQQENFEPIEAAPKSLELKQNYEILERERKNSKNEINAKLNNQGNFDSIATIFDAKRTFAGDDKRKIRRIDLRAYGFENEFNTNNNDIKKKQQRIPNKLDLRSYGYDSGLRRTQSNNQIDSKVTNSFLDSKTKSKLIDGKLNYSHQHCELSTNDDYNWTQSTENLIAEKKMMFEKFNGIKSAKSVPNIAKSGLYSYTRNKGDSIRSGDEGDDEGIHFSEEISHGYENSHQNRNGRSDSSTEMMADSATDSTNDAYNYESDSLSVKTASTDELPPRYATLKELKYSLESLEDSDTFIEKELPMPSVKVLAQTFNKPLLAEKSASKVHQSIGNTTKERPTTPEIQIIGTPRQMHSLTARSISREFREGLRQITSKSNTPSSNTTVIEQSKMPAGSSQSNTHELDNTINTAVIARGKLKNNIQFWEQLQKKN